MASVAITAHNKRVTDLHGDELYNRLTEVASVAFNDALDYRTVTSTHARLGHWLEAWLSSHVPKSKVVNTTLELADANMLTACDGLFSHVRHSLVTRLSEIDVLESTHVSSGDERMKFQFRPFRFEACCASTKVNMKNMHISFRKIFDEMDEYLPSLTSFQERVFEQRPQKLLPKGWSLDRVVVGAGKRNPSYPVHAEAGRDSLRTKNEYLKDEWAVIDGPRHERLVQQTYRFTDVREDKIYLELHWPVGFRCTRPDGKHVEINVEVIVVSVQVQMKNANPEDYIHENTSVQLFPLPDRIRTLTLQGWMLRNISAIVSKKDWARCGVFAVLACLHDTAETLTRESILRALDNLVHNSRTNVEATEHVARIVRPVLDALKSLETFPDDAQTLEVSKLKAVKLPVSPYSSIAGRKTGSKVVLMKHTPLTKQRWAVRVVGEHDGTRRKKGASTENEEVLAYPRDAATHDFVHALRLTTEAFIASHVLQKNNVAPSVDFVSAEALQDTFH